METAASKVDVRRAGPEDAEVVLTLVREIAALVERDRGLLVCGANATALTGQYRGPAIDVARYRTGLLLGRCGTLEADLLGVRGPGGGAERPGRGLLVSRGTATPIQVALAGSTRNQPPDRRG